MKKQIPGSVITFYTYGSPRCGDQGFSDFVINTIGSGVYQRVTHYNDMVPHLPITSMGFNHAGNEVWYNNAGDDLSYKQCANSAGKPENNACADSIIVTGIDAHLHYLGHPISGMCLATATNDPWDDDQVYQEEEYNNSTPFLA